MDKPISGIGELKEHWKTIDEDAESIESNQQFAEDQHLGHKRETWSGKMDFILSSIGFAVGLGNVWRFPYLCYRSGGGAFLVPYFIFLILCGMPLIMLEMSIGQFASLSPTGLFAKFCPMFQGLGWGMVIISGIVCIYYNIIITWTLYYLALSFQKVLPWTTCDGWWNTPHCVANIGAMKDQIDNASFFGNDTLNGNVTDDIIYFLSDTNDTGLNASDLSNVTKHTASEEFWQHYILRLSDGIEDLGDIQWQLLLCLVAAWILVYLCLCKGVKSSGRVVYVTATFPYLVLFILCIRGLTLPGAWNGVKFYLIPQWHKLKELNVWLDAASQIFYSVGAAWGAIITMSSYNKFSHNCYRDAIIIPLINCGTSIFAGIVVFSIIGFMSEASGIEIGKVIQSGPGLAFVVYPEAVTMLPGAPFWAILFFVMLLTIGVDSQFGMFETLVSACVDAFPGYLRERKMQFTAATCFLLFLLGIPCVTQGGMFVLTLMDWYSATFSLMIIAMLECILLCYNYGYQRYMVDMSLMIKKRPSNWFPLCWAIITPLIILLLLILNFAYHVPASYNDYKYPGWAIGLGWIMALMSLAPIPFFMILNMYRAKGTFTERVRECMRPKPEWGPSLLRDRITFRKSFAQIPTKQEYVAGIDDNPADDEFDGDCEMKVIGCQSDSKEPMGHSDSSRKLLSAEDSNGVHFIPAPMSEKARLGLMDNDSKHDLSVGTRDETSYNDVVLELKP